MNSSSLQQTPPIRLRAPLLGLILAVTICVVTPYNNIFLQATPLGGGHFPLAPFAIFLLLAVLISLLARLFRPLAFLNGIELLVIWIEMVIGSGIAYTGLARTFLINITAPIHYATAGNHWQETLQPLLPAGLSPTDPGAIDLLYRGLAGGRTMGWLEVLGQIPWSAWLRPLAMWGGFIFVGYLVMIFLVNILSRQWMHNERMNFPLLKVPQMISEAMDQGQMGQFFTNRFLLVGVAVPLLLHLTNGISLYYPSIPSIPTLLLAGSYVADHGMLAGFAKLKLYFYPAFIGFAFLTSRPISFSFWFFFLLGGLFYGALNTLGYSIPASELGITFGPTLTRPEEMQMIGAYGTFFLFLLWLARQHLVMVVRQSLGLAPAQPRQVEWFDVRISFWGALAGFTILIAWYVLQGMTLTTAILLVGAFYMITLVATRIICQGGLAYFTLTAAPMDGMIALLGTKMFAGTSGLLAGMSQKILFVDLRESLMPSLVHGKAIHQNLRPATIIFGGMMATILLATIASVVSMMALCYRFGIRELQLEWANQTTIGVYENINRLVAAQVESGQWVYTFAVGGALVMLVLVVCYHRLYWWPIHPIGYLTAYSSAMRILWLSFFLGWLCNTLCMRYGGIHLYRRLQYFFIGLIIGDFLMGGGWAIVSLFTGMSYQVLPS
ncbi:MAG: DUF6785 family protein [Desulfopila sp.]